MKTQTQTGPAVRGLIKQIDRGTIAFAQDWLKFFLIVYGIWVLAPFAAPVLMQVGATGPAQVIYNLYSLFCHQLPERSLFFFGTKPMYTLPEIGQVWSTANVNVLRQFIGNAQMGWKMAWSDRMISTYGGVWLAGLLYAAWKPRAPRLSLKAWVLIGMTPILLDGMTHMVNDVLAGTTGTGFRDTNAWLQALTLNTLPLSFYQGDQLGSFNSWMRWLTGFLFSFTTVFALFPLIESSLRQTASDAARQYERVLTHQARNTGNR